jgi:hypothetical protein
MGYTWMLSNVVIGTIYVVRTDGPFYFTPFVDGFHQLHSST